MQSNHDHRNILVERRLDLPNKDEEIELFLNCDPVSIFDEYLPLADYLLDEYACPNDDARMLIEENVYNGLLLSIIRFRNKKRYGSDSTFTFFFSYFVADLMADLIKEGKVYKIGRMEVV